MSVTVESSFSDDLALARHLAALASEVALDYFLQNDRQIVLGLITRPVLGLSWWACSGCGAYRTSTSDSPDAVRLRVSTKSRLMTSRVTMWTKEDDPMVARLKRNATWVEPDLDAILRLAEGELEAVIDRLGKPWDHAPAVVLVQEAGVAFSDPQGGHRIDLGEVRYTNGLVHDQFEALLGE
jgi:histidinol-phosphatase